MNLDDLTYMERLKAVEERMDCLPNVSASDAADVYIGEIAVYAASIADDLHEIKELLKQDKEKTNE